MLIVITICLVLLSVMLIFVKKNRESHLLLGACISLALEICGVMIFIAKKGGISEDVMLFFYFSKNIQMKIRYLGITLNQLGYFIAIGRTLFPMFILMLSLNYSMVQWIRGHIWITHLVKVLPVASLILYYPGIYRSITEKYSFLKNVIMEFNTIWLSAYLLIGIVLFAYEFHSINIKFIKRQFAQISACIVSMCALYILYFQQDPGQVYRFYSVDFVWNKGIGYLQFNPSLSNYVGLVAVTLAGVTIGFYSFFRYTTGMYEEQREDIVIQRKFNMAKVGASMFVHGMKNQLLASKVVYKRIRSICEQPDIDVNRLKECVDSLENLNSAMLSRVEELYRSVKTNAINMIPVSIEEIFEDSIERFRKKYPEVQIQIMMDDSIFILADKSQLCEAIYNVLINAQDAIIDAQRESGRIELKCYIERMYTIIEVADNGKGMSKTQLKKIFEPFYSSKNSNYNWGMGMYFTREVVKGHLGFMKVESQLGHGSRFFIILPKYN